MKLPDVTAISSSGCLRSSRPKDPCRLTVRSVTDVIVIDDILIGELWYAAGQDNMAQTVRESDVEHALDECVNLRDIRFFQMSLDGLSEQIRQYSYTPLGEAQGGEWQRGDQVYLMKDQSAVAFSFAVDFYNEWQIPVGVINAAGPGTYIHSWLPREIIEADPIIRNHVREVRLYRDRDNWNAETAEREQREDRYGTGAFKSFPRPQTVALLDGRKPDRADPAPLVVPRATIRKSTLIQQMIPLAHEFSPRKQPSTMFNHKVSPLWDYLFAVFYGYKGERCRRSGIICGRFAISSKHSEECSFLSIRRLRLSCHSFLLPVQWFERDRSCRV